MGDNFSHQSSSGTPEHACEYFNSDLHHWNLTTNQVALTQLITHSQASYKWLTEGYIAYGEDAAGLEVYNVNGGSMLRFAI